MLLQVKDYSIHPLLSPKKTCWGDMYNLCVNVMQILLQLFQLLFLGNIVIARQIKVQTQGEHLRVPGSAAHDERKTLQS